MQIGKKKEWWWGEHFSTLLAKSDFYLNQILFTIFCSTDLEGREKKGKSDHVNKTKSPHTSKTKTPFPGQQAGGIWHFILRQIMPGIVFSVHLRQQAAHYLHSTQISGLVRAGISFRSEWICLLSKGRARHTHLLKGVTLKRACVPPCTQLFIWIFDSCKNESCSTKSGEKKSKFSNIDFIISYLSSEQ